MAYNIISAKDLDYSSVGEICGYQLLMCKIFERAGGFGRGATCSRKEISIVKREGLVWLQNVKKTIGKIVEGAIRKDLEDARLTLGDIPRLLNSYDFFYRVCNNGPCYDFVREITLKTADRWAKGDKTISESQVALMLQKEINRDISTIARRYIDFSMSVLCSWVDDLRMYGKIRNISQEDSYFVIGSLLWQDLFTFGVKKEDKVRWIGTYALDESDIECLDMNALWAYINFEQKATSFLGNSFNELDDRYVHLINRISLSPEINRFAKEAIELEMANFKVA